MAISIDYATLVISVPQADLAFVSGTLYEHDTNAFRLALKDLEDDSDGMAFDRTHKHNTEVTVAGTTFARTIEIINGYSVEYEDTGSQYSVRLSGSNNNIFDVENGILVQNGVQIIAQNSAGLVNPAISSATQLQLDQIHGQIQRSVHVNTELATNGNGYQQSPFNDLSDAIDSAENLGLRRLVIMADIILDRNVKNFDISGIGLPEVDTNGFDLKNTSIERCQLTGSFTSDIIAEECIMLDGVLLNGFYTRCAFAGSAICADNSMVTLVDSLSAIPGASRPTISLSLTGTTNLAMRSQRGGINISNCNNVADNVTVEMMAGAVTLEATCTSGTIVLRGVGENIDNSAGSTVIDQMVGPTKTIAAEVWEVDRTTLTTTDSVGEYVTKKLLKFTQFVGLK